MNPTRSIVCLLLIGLAATAGNFARAQTPPKAELLRDLDIVQNLDAQVPLGLTFVDEAGREVTLGDYVNDKPVVLALAYYECPMLCTLVLNGMLEAMQELTFDAGKEFNVVVASFDPGETPALAAAKKKRYLLEYGRAGAADGWHFLTSPGDSAKKLADVVGFEYAYDEATDEYAHASAIMLLTPQGKVSRYFYGVTYDSKDLRLSLIEASQNRIGTIVDKVLLWCFHYDPTTGKYGLVIMNVMRAGGAMTVGVFVVFVGTSLWRDRRGRMNVRELHA